MGRGSRSGMDKKCLFIIERIKCDADFQNRKLRKMKKIYLVCSECRILEMTGRTEIVFLWVFLTVKEVYR